MEKIALWPIQPVEMITGAAPDHPLALLPRSFTLDDVQDHWPLVPSDRTNLTDGLSFGVCGTRIRQIADLGVKLAMLRAGPGRDVAAHG